MVYAHLAHAKGKTNMRTLYHMQTRHGLYSIALQQHNDGTFMILEYKRGREQACAYLGSADRETAVMEYNSRIDEAAFYDGIFYTRAVR